MSDEYGTNASGLDSPARKAFAITPDDNNDLAYTTRAIYTGAGGTIVCTMAGDSSDTTFTNVPAGLTRML